MSPPRAGAVGCPNRGTVSRRGVGMSTSGLSLRRMDWNRFKEPWGPANKPSQEQRLAHWNAPWDRMYQTSCNTCNLWMNPTINSLLEEKGLWGTRVWCPCSARASEGTASPCSQSCLSLDKLPCSRHTPSSYRHTVDREMGRECVRKPNTMYTAIYLHTHIHTVFLS